MAESKHEKSSAIVPFKYKKDTPKKIKWNLFVISFVEIIILLVIAWLFCQINIYADTNSCGSEFWTYLSNAGNELVCAAIGLAATILSIVKGVKILRYKGWYKFISIMVFIFMFLIGALSPLCLFTFFHIQGAVEKEEEAKKQVTQTSSTQMSSMQMSANNEQESKKFKVIITYNINRDLYMENRPLDDYYSGEITAENSKLVRAKILDNNLEYNKPEGSISDNYRELLETADYHYNVYLYKKGYADERKNTSEEWFEDRIESLQESLDVRGEAEKECESPENERPMATGYRDKGDEYFSKKNQNMAMDSYEESADWFMKAIYHAAAIGDYEEVHKCMTKFKELGVEVEKLEEIDLSRRNKITEWIDVYEIFVELVSESK